jgi:hypothetical protein
MRRILHEAVPLVVAFRRHVGVDHGPEADEREEQPADQDGRQRAVYKLDDYKDGAFADLAVVDLAQPGDDEAEDGGDYGISHVFSSVSITTL